MSENPLLKTLTEEPQTFFSAAQLSLVDLNTIPKHIAIIPDGNRRWAKKQEFASMEGHRQGADILMDIVKAGKELGVKVLTFFFFSTENWSRERSEVDALMWLLQSYLDVQCESMIENGIRFQCIGDLNRIPAEVLKTVHTTIEATASCNKVDLVLAINYGSRNEICRAVQHIASDALEEKIHPLEISEEMISQYLDTASWMDPDLLIRTSGELRISNFLLWQLSYTEIYTTKTLWPEFNPSHLFEAVLEYQQRDRRRGGA